MLKFIIMGEWQNISPNVTKKLVESMPRSLNAVIKGIEKSPKY